MSDLLAALQLGDSQFPSGAFSHSFGLETLVAEGHVRSSAELAALVDVHLRERLARADLPALLAAHEGAGALELVCAIDRELRAVKLTREERQGSERMGRRLTIEVLRLVPDPALNAFDGAVRDGRAPGNHAVALGLAGRALGLDARQTALVACYTAASALVSAAQRLVRLGHGPAQAVLGEARPAMTEALTRAEGVSWRDLCPCAPGLDVASGRHERAAARMFAS
jgi:urease accessory protein